MVGESQQIIAHFQFIGNARCCIRMSYAIPFIVAPYTLWVHMKPKLVKEMKNCKITFFYKKSLCDKICFWIFQNSLFKNMLISK